MRIIEILVSAFRSITANKMRSFLTMLGIIISVSGVVLIHVVGQCLNDTIENSLLKSSAVNNAQIVIQPSNRSYNDGLWVLDIPERLKFSDEMVAKFCEKFDGAVNHIKYSRWVSATAPCFDGGVTKVDFQGVNSYNQTWDDTYLLSGRYITEEDLDQRRNTAVISEYTAKFVFGADDPIGQYIYFTDEDGYITQFVVVGVYRQNDKQFEDDESNKKYATFDAFVSYTYFLQQYPDKKRDTMFAILDIGGINDYDSFKRDSYAYFDQYVNDPNWEVSILVVIEVLEFLRKVIKIMTIVTTIITAISMLVGGMGIMNIMMVSVNERTREIGVKKAIGAGSGYIITEFIAESALISVMSSVIGVLCGLLLSFDFVNLAKIITQNIPTMLTLNVEFEPPYMIMALAVAASVVTGIVFGVFPAVRASRMNIIDSLRQE